MSRVSSMLARYTNGLATLITTSAVHLTNDACFALLYPLLPFIAADLNLSYSQVGLLKASFSGASSVLQIPAGMAGARYGEMLVLMLGNAWVGAGLIAMALTGSFVLLLGAAVLAGIGGNAQHPLGASIVSKAVPKRQMAMALGTLNFSGDLGKLAGPFVAGIVATQYGWRVALGGLGLFTALFSIVLLLGSRDRSGEGAPAWRRATATAAGDSAIQRGFRNVLLAGGLDNATRGAALTFLPFVLADKGLSAANISALFGLIFAAGAAGKFVCGWMTDRWGILAVIVATETVTAIALVAILKSPIWATVPLVLLFGFALNGTSSALNVGVAQFVPPERRAKGYGTYFTAALASSAVAPLAYGVLGDISGLTVVFIVMAVLTIAVIPAIIPVRRILALANQPS
jgi:MFS transporter, FSR family, fosmidomycin resistance protein